MYKRARSGGAKRPESVFPQRRWICKIDKEFIPHSSRQSCSSQAKGNQRTLLRPEGRRWKIASHTGRAASKLSLNWTVLLRASPPWAVHTALKNQKRKAVRGRARHWQFIPPLAPTGAPPNTLRITANLHWRRQKEKVAGSSGCSHMIVPFNEDFTSHARRASVLRSASDWMRDLI